MQFGRGGSRQAQSDAVAADAGEHLIADEAGVKAVDLPCADTRKFEKQSVKLRLAARISGINTQSVSVAVVMNRGMEL